MLCGPLRAGPGAAGGPNPFKPGTAAQVIEDQSVEYSAGNSPVFEIHLADDPQFPDQLKGLCLSWSCHELTIQNVGTYAKVPTFSSLRCHAYFPARRRRVITRYWSRMQKNDRKEQSGKLNS